MKILGLLMMVLLSACQSGVKEGSCKKDADCKDAVCVFGKCQECAVNSDCKDGKVCTDNQCVQNSTSNMSPDNLTSSKASAPACTQAGTVHFDFNQYDIKSNDRDLLTDIAACLRSNPDSKITVAGNTDDRGTVEYNLALGEKRAKSVSKYLQNSGISDSRMHVVSYGKEKPVDPENNEAAWAKNRRADITVD